MFAVSKNNPHGGGILTCVHMLPPSSQKKSSQREDFDLGLHASHHLKNNPPKGRIHKRWDKNPVLEILLIEGYLHVSTFYSVCIVMCAKVVPSTIVLSALDCCKIILVPKLSSGNPVCHDTCHSSLH